MLILKEIPISTVAFVLGIIAITSQLWGSLMAPWAGWLIIIGYIAAPLAVVFGIVALWQIKAGAAESKGKGYAWIGLILGVIQVLFLALLYYGSSTAI